MRFLGTSCRGTIKNDTADNYSGNNRIIPAPENPAFNLIRLLCLHKFVSSKHEKLDQLQSNIGKALWQIQALEDTLAHLISIVLNIPRDASIEEAEAILNNTRRKTLGKLISETNKIVHFANGFDTTMSAFVEDRNWLVHRCWRENRDILNDNKDNEYRNLSLRIRGIASEALKINKVFADITLDWQKQQALLKYRNNI